MTYIARLIVALVCISMVACTTLKPMALGDGAPHAAVGYMVHVGNRDGSFIDLKIVELRDGGFVGTRSKGGGKTERVEVRYADILSMERAEFSAWKTVGLFGILFAIAAAIAFSGSYGYTF